MNPDAKRFGRGTKFISVMDVLNNQYILYDNIRASVELQDGDIETYGVDYGDILFQRSSETLEDVGRANVYLDSKPAIFGGFVIRGKSKGNYNPLFFRYLLASPTARKRIIVKGEGAQHFNIGQDGLSKVSLDVPSLQEQEKIGKLLQCVDARIATQTKIIEDLKKLKSAIAQKLFNDRVLLETRISLGEVCELKNGYALKSSSYCIDGKYNILTIANVQGSSYISTESCKTISYLPNDLQEHQVLRENDILISMTGNVGRVSLCSKGHYLLNQRVGLLVPKIKEAEFLFQVLASERFEQSMIACGQGAAQINIGKNDIDGYLLPFSRKSDNMSYIAKVLQAYDNCINTNVRLLDFLILQKQYLLSQMFI